MVSCVVILQIKMHRPNDIGENTVEVQLLNELVEHRGPWDGTSRPGTILGTTEDKDEQFCFLIGVIS